MHRELTSALRRIFRPTDGEQPHDAFDIMYQFGNGNDALLYAVLFVPEFVEIDGSVIMTSGNPGTANFLDAKKAGRYPIAELEALFNFVEVGYLFANRSSAEHDDTVLAQAIVAAWKGQLALQFPGREFRFAIELPEITGSVTGVCFCEIRG
jgi:hypothetical protein